LKSKSNFVAIRVGTLNDFSTVSVSTPIKSGKV